jgi:hypothetical protein
LGNHNSGPSGRSSGISVEACTVIDASRLTRAGHLRNGIKRLDLSYSSSSGEQLDYPIFLEETRPNFGGTRWWFRCPMCTRRVRKLFIPPRREYFGCRNCYRLTYNSRKENHDGRYWSTLQKIYSRLGGNVHSDPTFPPKPKGMWTRTYERLMAKAEAAPEVRLGRLLRRRAARRYPFAVLRSIESRQARRRRKAESRRSKTQ